MRIGLRAVSYFRDDVLLVSLLIVIVIVSTGLGLLMAWPLAILVDSVLETNHQMDIWRRAFFAILPSSRLGQVLGLALLSLALKFLSDILTMVRTLLNNQ